MTDGVWNGTGNGFKGPMEVSITVEKGKIVDAKLISTSDSEFALASIDEVLTQAVKKGNAKKLDTVSGATYTSKGTIEAIQNAAEKASGNAKMADGTWEGTADGFKGPMTVSITVKDNKIVDAKLVKTEDSEFAHASINEVLAQAVKKGDATKLDSVSGATYSSNGAIAALGAAVGAAKGFSSAKAQMGTNESLLYCQHSPAMEAYCSP